MKPPPIYRLGRPEHSTAQLKPASQLRVEARPAPSVYRPNQSSAPSAQLKPANNFRLERRPAPPVYRPQQNASSRVQLKPVDTFKVEMRPALPVYWSQNKTTLPVQRNANGFRQETRPAPPIYHPPGVTRSLASKTSTSSMPGAQKSFGANPPPAVQRYTLVTDGPFTGKKSENGRYVTGTDLSEIYVLPGSTVERSQRTSRVFTIAKVNYEVWAPQFSVIEDCVAAMEEIMHGEKLKYGAPDLSEFRDVVSKGKKKRKSTFGDSDAQNRKLGKETDLGEGADPGLLEGYVIARQSYKRDQERPQFHGAAVVAQDGDDNITLEATAPSSGPSSRGRVLPVYDMYSRGKKRKQSFKIAFKGEYGKDATVSVVKAIKPLSKESLEPVGSLQIVDFV